MKSTFYIALFASLLLCSCIEITRPYSKIPPGIWRAELTLDKDVVLPFNFEITYDDSDQLIMTIHNAEERIAISDITFGKNIQLQDTLVIDFALMDSYLDLQYKENVLEGWWHVRNRKNYKLPFVAFFGQAHRFTTDNTPPVYSVDGLWEARFEIETAGEYPAIAELKQNKNHLSGTFLTETGDYRFLEGTVQGNQLSLSAFDGSHAFLITAELRDQETLLGTFFSGNHYKTNWLAKKNPNASLRHPEEVTTMIHPDRPITLILPKDDGELVDISQGKYAGKPKILMLMGTWCPNCLDESKYILDFQKKHDMGDIEVLAIAFERLDDTDRALQMINRYRQRLNIPYDILYGGGATKKEATEALGFVEEVVSFPTLVFLDRQNKVNAIHTGFNGPATSKYEEFNTYFQRQVNKLLESK